MRRWGAWLLFLGAACAQTPAFDVASVKPSPPSPGDAISITLGAVNHGVVRMTNVTLGECVRWAYDLVSAEQLTGPAWIEERATRFDIIAKASPDTPLRQLRLMMRALLAERFALKLHSEPKRIEHYELTVSKAGLKLAVSPGDGPSHSPEYRTGVLNWSHLPMHTLAILLARQLKLLVLDSTNVSGFYDVNLQWTPDDADVAGVDIFSALRKVGLNLERLKSPVDIWTVDSAEKTPREN
jgi:uncharacterized protein (TIGR03435 family)